MVMCSEPVMRAPFSGWLRRTPRGSPSGRASRSRRWDFLAAPVGERDGTGLVVTVHPSSLLRIPDAGDKHAAYAAFVKDLKVAARMVFKKAA
jgi:uracil-DNA glycosylase